MRVDDEWLATRVWKNRSVRDISEKATFGGWTCLLNGNLFVAPRHHGLLVRWGKKEAWALKTPDIVPIISRGCEPAPRLTAITHCASASSPRRFDE